MTATYQRADENGIDDEPSASIDVALETRIGRGELLLYVEGSTEPVNDGIIAKAPEANDDVGTALDGDGDTRMQVSELRYAWPLSARTQVAGGLLDPTVFLDTSQIANDESTQFLGAGFVNNPTVAFPDYTLGVLLSRRPTNDRPGVLLMLTGSNGLADNPDAAYGELFDLFAGNKGIFAAAELQSPDWYGASLRLGAWANTREDRAPSGKARSDDKHGFYAVADGPLGGGDWALRLGWADEDASTKKTFVAGAVTQPFGSATVGLGIARSGAADRLGPTTADTVQAEAFARFQLDHRVRITPDIQYIANAGLDEATDVFVYGLRVGLQFGL